MISSSIQSARLFHQRAVLIELREEPRIALREFRIDLQADVCPAADPVAIMQIRMNSVAVPRVRLVITASRAQRPDPACAAVRLVRDVMIFEEETLAIAIDTVIDGAKLVRVRPRESMTERHITVRRNPHQAETSSAWVRFANAFVDFSN